MSVQYTKVLSMSSTFPNKNTAEEQLAEWRAFYLNVFRIALDGISIQIPPSKRDFKRFIVVASGITPNTLYTAILKHFPCSRHYTDLDSAGTNIARPTAPYAVWIRDAIESDETLKNRSADELQAENIQGITLLEHMLYHLKYFIETGMHLDLLHITMCSGSRMNDGRVPSIMFGKNELKIHWCAPHERNQRLRARQVIST